MRPQLFADGISPSRLTKNKPGRTIMRPQHLYKRVFAGWWWWQWWQWWRWWWHFAISRTNGQTEQPTNPQSDSILPWAGPTDRRKKGYFCSLVMMTVMTVIIMVIMIVAPIIIERNFHSGALSAGKKMIFADFWKRVTDRRTDGRTNGPTDGPTDGQTLL